MTQDDRTHAEFETSAGVESPVVIPCPPDRLDDLFRLRADVWTAEGADPGAFPDGRWCNQRDATRSHWVVLDQDQLVASASLSVHDRLEDVEEGEVYVAAGLQTQTLVAAPARVTVAVSHRGRGLGQALLCVQDEAARRAGATLAVRQASREMRRLLERRGWRSHGPGPFDPRFPKTTFTIMSLLLPIEAHQLCPPHRSSMPLPPPSLQTDLGRRDC